MIYFWVFAVSFSFSVLLLSLYPVLAAFDDNYFYIKLAQLFSEGGFFQKLPWLYYSIYRENFTGHHFLYWFLMFPFVRFIENDLLAAKIYQSLILALSSFSLFFIFRNLFKLNNKTASFFVFILYAAPTPFLWRMLNIRPLTFSLLFLLLVFYFLLKEKHLWLWLVNFFFVWAYDGYFLSLVLVILWSIYNFISGRKLNFKPFLYSLSGILWGLIINPFFPNNILFMHITIVNPIKALYMPLSVEWLPPRIEFWPWGHESIVAYFLLALILAFWAFLRQKNNRLYNNFQLYVFLIFSVFYLFFARFIDYLLPFALIFFASFYKKLLVELKNFPLKQKKVFVFAGSAYLVLSFLFNFKELNSYFVSQPKISRYEAVSQFLKQHTVKGEIIFNINWSSFPTLFYANDYNYYVAGLGRQFMKTYDPQRDFIYEIINRGMIYCEEERCLKEIKYCDYYLDKKYAKAIKEIFGSKVVFIDLFWGEDIYRPIFNVFNVLNRSPYFGKIYEGFGYNKGVYLFKVLI